MADRASTKSNAMQCNELLIAKTMRLMGVKGIDMDTINEFR
jgi:hypothetical protein